MTNEDLKRFYSVNTQGAKDFARLNEFGKLDPNVIDTAPVIITAAQNITVNNVLVPKLTEQDVVDLYNGFVAGKVTRVVDATQAWHFNVQQADSLNDEPSVIIHYFATMILTYTVTDTGVEVSYKAL